MEKKTLPEAVVRVTARLAFILALGARLTPAFSGEPAVLLSNSIAEAGHVTAGGDDLTVAGSTTFYQVEVPSGTQVLEVRLVMQNGDADLYVGPEMTLDPFDYPFASVQIGLATEGGGIDQTTTPALGAYSVWYMAVHGYDETNFYIIASWGTADAATPLENGKPVTSHVMAGLDMIVFPQSTLYYSVDVGEEAESLEVVLNGILGDADLFLGRTLSASFSAYDKYSALTGTADEVIRLNATTVPGPADSRVWYIAVHGYEESGFTLTATWKGKTSSTTFLRGDCNGDRAFDISDAVAHLAALYLSGTVPCLAACDSNGDGVSDISDAVYSLGSQYLNGPPPPGPFPACGAPAADPVLSCEAPLSCGG